MKIDFTKLNNLTFSEKQETTSAKRPLRTSVEPLCGGVEYKDITQNKKATEQATTGLERLQRESDNIKAEKDRILAIYQEYQQNTKLSEQLQIDIIKGTQNGEDIYSLFLKAVRTISLMTSNKAFYSQVESDIRRVGTGHTPPPPKK